MASLHVGVEETKDDFGSDGYEHCHHQSADGNGNGNTRSNSQQSGASACDASDGVQGVLEIITRNIFGSCGNVVEAAAFFVQSGFQRSPQPTQTENLRTAGNDKAGNANCGRQPHVRRKVDPLAPFAGRYQSKSLNPRGDALNPALDMNQHNAATTEIPSYLAGETVSYSFDDNISALSAHTLEEMEKKKESLKKKVADTSILYRPPSPTRTSSSSTGSQRSIHDVSRIQPGGDVSSTRHNTSNSNNISDVQL